ncbi:MAG: hypothetical protein AAGU19_00230 [Prolixibacteraceae bacterium]
MKILIAMILKIIDLFRFLRSNGIFTALNIAGLAFGFACAMLIILHVGKEYSYNSQIPIAALLTDSWQS